ncbi:hypothetical protein [Serratia ureilytica]|uniref:hypothetical protein n=1 Tax=Serratia ureilytica TaxID=300181 RepID=UPI00214F13EB|nr:hypothetical protein [Serratia ureilytica]UUW17354.1 hypothetical protein NAL25_19415 [Serratia ureilytica]
MFKLTAKFLTFCLGATVIAAGFPAHSNHSGTVRFYGAIVEPVCQASLASESRKIHLDCSTRSDNAEFAVEGDIAHTRLDYLDAKQTLAVVSINYR